MSNLTNHTNATGVELVEPLAESTSDQLLDIAGSVVSAEVANTATIFGMAVLGAEG